MAPNFRSLKITIVGDSIVGKTALIITYTENEFPKDYQPHSPPCMVSKISVDGKNCSLFYCETTGFEGYARLRPLSYPNTDCFLLCYAISDRESFENVLSKWYPELQKYSPGVPIVLVGTKSDLRVSESKEFVSLSEAKDLMSKIKAAALVECSAFKNENLEKVFQEAVRTNFKRPKKFSSSCKIL